MSNRWVNLYTLRYAVGTVIGAVIVSYLFLRLPPEVRAQAPSLDAWGKIVVLGASGLAFCYIASAPLLVIHVCRSLLLHRRGGGVYTGLGVCMVVGSFAGAYGFTLFVKDVPLFAVVASGCFSSILCLQFLALRGVTVRRDSLLAFYRNLATKRYKDKSGLVESYRDMREHGNAFAIVLLEVFLGAMVTGIMDLGKEPKTLAAAFIGFLLLVGLWIVPAALVLYVAARLEIDFSEG